MRRLRVALVHPYSLQGVRRGAERYLDDLARYLAAAGHEPVVVTARRGRPRSEGWFAAGAFTRHATRRLDVVHALTPAAALAGAASGVPTVFTVLGHPTGGQFAGRRGLHRQFERAARRAAVTAALSHASAAAVASVIGRRAVVLPPGVWLDRFPPALEPRTGPPRLLFSADASDRRKGVHWALAAFGWVLDAHPDARLQLSGQGDHRWALPGLGAAAGRILAATDDLGVGAVEDQPGRYRAATVTVLPSVYEAFGLVLAESLASGTPVVCSDDGGMPEVAGGPGTSRVVPPGDVARLAGALVEAVGLAAEPGTPRRCRDAATAWGWDESVGPRHVRLYRDVIG